MILRVRFRDSVNVQGLGELQSVSSDLAVINMVGGLLIIYPKGKPTQVTVVSVAGNVLWHHEAPEPVAEPEKKPAKKK